MANNINLDNFLEESDNFDFETTELAEPAESIEQTELEATDTMTDSVIEENAKTEKTPVQETNSDETDPFEAAFKKSEKQTNVKLISALAEKNPFFSFIKVEEEITDEEITFDELRAKYEADFPELSESKKVSWTVTYGKTTKSVANPQTDKVYEIKAEIEKSKKFLDDLKKAKTDADKNPKCIVKPKVTAQSKGDVSFPNYKEFCTDYDHAFNSKKAIAYIPARDGRVYEVRNNEIGTFVSPAREIHEFKEISEFFALGLPKIPFILLHEIISFFKAINDKTHTEALVHILYHKEYKEYVVNVPDQTVSMASVSSDLEEYPEHLIHVMDIHSHNIMQADFSVVDDKDEKATRLYGVIGRLNNFYPEMKFRASNGGKFIDIDPSLLFDFEVSYPSEWLEPLNDSFKKLEENV